MWKATTNYTQKLQLTDFRIIQKDILTWLLPVFLVTAMLFLAGCRKTDPGKIGIDVIPPRLGVNFTDTLKLNFQSKVIDKVVSGNAPAQLLGNYLDPTFGRISANVYSQVKLRGVDVEFGDSLDLKFTSLTLDIDVSSYYGRLDVPMQLHIYELKEELPGDVGRMRSDSLPPEVFATDLANYTIDFSQTQAVSKLSIPLSAAFGKKILYADADSLKDNDIFGKFFKGFMLSTETAGLSLSREPGAIFQLLFSTGASRLHLAYKLKNTTTGEFEDQTLDFSIGNDAQKYHTIKRTEAIDTRLIGTQSTYDDDIYEFIESGAQVQVSVSFPTLKNLGLIAINQAEIVFKVDPIFLGSAGRYTPPKNIYLFLADDDGALLRDDEGRTTLFSSQPYSYDDVEKEYRMDISGHIQAFVNGRKEHSGLVLIPADSAVNVSRVVLGGLKHPTLKPIFNLTYTNLPE